jgi:hypothetical protein
MTELRQAETPKKTKKFIKETASTKLITILVSIILLFYGLTIRKEFKGHNVQDG